MKTIIFYSSTYHGNTLKVGESMATVLSADLVPIETQGVSDADLSKYDLVGLGSAIHFARHDVRLLRFASTLSMQGKRVFIFSTRCRPFLGSYHKALKEVIKKRGGILVGEFSCVGFDRTGLWVLMNGYHKGRPDATDLCKARLFVEKLQRTLHPLASIVQEAVTDYRQGIAFRMKGDDAIAGNRVVFLNTASCIRCGKCVKVCPMDIFRKSAVVLPTNEANCIQCQLCAQNCPTDSIYINESFANGVRIALREMCSTKLQDGYNRKAD